MDGGGGVQVEVGSKLLHRVSTSPWHVMVWAPTVLASLDSPSAVS